MPLTDSTKNKQNAANKPRHTKQTGETLLGIHLPQPNTPQSIQLTLFKTLTKQLIQKRAAGFDYLG